MLHTDLTLHGQNTCHHCQKVRSANPKKLEKNPKLQAVRQKKGSYCGLDDDHEFDYIMKNARRTLESKNGSAMPLHNVLSTKRIESKKGDIESGGRPLANKWVEIQTTGFHSRCSVHDHKEAAVEAHRRRIEESTGGKLQDLVADRGHVSMTQYNLVHKPIPIPQSRTNPDTCAEVDEEWNKFQKASNME